MRRVKRASGGRLRAASLVEAVVAAVVLLIVFTAVRRKRSDGARGAVSAIQ